MSPASKSLWIILAVLFIGLQYKLWIAKDGFRETLRLKKEIVLAADRDDKLLEKNQLLMIRIHDLKTTRGKIEDLAREELEMIKPNETYYQFVKSTPNEKTP